MPWTCLRLPIKTLQRALPLAKQIIPTPRGAVARSGDGQVVVINEDYPQPTYPINDRRFTGKGGFKVEIYYFDGVSTTQLDVTELVMSIKWSDSLDQAAVEGTIEMYDTFDPIAKDRRLKNIQKGNRVKVSVINDNDKLEELGRFVIWQKSRKSRTDATFTLEIKDMLVYLQQSQDTWLFQRDVKKKSKHKKGWTAAQITEYVCKRYSIPLDKANLPKCKHFIPLVKIDSGSVYELLLKVWTEERKVTGNKFIIRCENDKLRIIAKREQPVLHAVQEGQNLIDGSFTDSLQGMFNAVTVVSEAASNKTSATQQSTNRDSSANRTDTYQSTGGGWKKGVTSFFTPSGEKELAYGDPNSDDLVGWGEADNNTAMGGLPGHTMIEVKYKGKTLQLPKVDNGAGGDGIGAIPRIMDLTIAAADKLGINRDPGKVIIEWRKLDGTGTTASAVKASSGVLATAKNQAKIDKYGYLHKVIKLDKSITKADAKKQAIQALRSTLLENLEGSVTCYLLPRLRAGAPVFVKDSGARLIGKFYCSQVSHTIEPGGCTTEIGLNWLDMVPSALLTDEDKGIKKATGSSNNCGEKAVAAGRKYIGTPYSWGGGGSNGPSYGIARTNGQSGTNIKGFDCSGFVQYCWAQAGVSVPRHTDALAQVGQSVPIGQEQVGDILLYGTSDGAGSRYGHTALCSGSGMIINSGGAAGGGVREYARSDHVLVRRVSHLCKEKTTGGGGGGGGGDVVPTTIDGESTVIMYQPFAQSKFPERASTGSPVRARTDIYFKKSKAYITYNGKEVEVQTVMATMPVGVHFIVGTEIAEELGIRNKPMQKFDAIYNSESKTTRTLGNIFG